MHVAGSTGDALPGNTSVGDNDAFLIKSDSAGTQQWARQFGTGASQYVAGFASIPPAINAITMTCE